MSAFFDIAVYESVPQFPPGGKHGRRAKLIFVVEQCVHQQRKVLRQRAGFGKHCRISLLSRLAFDDSDFTIVKTG
jgi:hypothetical protein